MDKIRHFFKTAFFRNIFILVSGGIFAQAITFLLMPFITRLYSPADLGVLGIFMSVIAVSTQIAALSYPIALILPKTDEEAFSLVRLSIYITVVSSLMVLAIFYIFKLELSEFLNLETSVSYLYLIPIAMFISSVMNISEQWATRKQLFKIKSISLSIRAIMVNALKITFGFLSPTPFGLIVATIIGFLAQLIILILGAVKNGSVIKIKNIASYKLKTVAIKYKEFPIFRAPEQFLDSINSGLPVLMIANFAGPEAAGYLSLAILSLGAPIMLMGSAVRDVFYPQFSIAFNAGEALAPMLIKTTLMLTALSLPVLIFTLFIAPDLFSFVFGAEWRVAGEYSRYLIFWVLIMLINKPSVAALPVLRIQGKFLIYTCISIVTNLAGFIIGNFLFTDPLKIILIFSTTNTLLYILLILYTINYTQKLDRNKLT